MTTLQEELFRVVSPAYVTSEGQHFVVRPSSLQEVSEVMLLARTYDASVLPVGSARRSVPSDDTRPQLLLNMSRLSHILALDMSSLVVHVQGGLTGRELESRLGERGLTLGDLPIASLDSTIGGLLSVRTPGKSSRRHGTLEEAVLGVTGVLGDGRIVRTRVAPRRASGPDLARVLCGSEGALGIIVAAHLRVHRNPESRFLAAYRLPTFESGLTAVRLSLKEEASPVAMRIYDSDEATYYLGDVCEPGQAILAVATAGPTSLAACDRDLIESACLVVGGERADDKIARSWWKQRSAVAHQGLPNLQMSATPSVLPVVYSTVVTGAQELGVRARAHGSRFDRDGGILLFTVTDPDSSEVLPDSDDLVTELSRRAQSQGGYPLTKTNSALPRYFDLLRSALDPDRRLNPGVLRR